jgi:hypothetical protein
MHLSARAGSIGPAALLAAVLAYIIGMAMVRLLCAVRVVE